MTYELSTIIGLNEVYALLDYVAPAAQCVLSALVRGPTAGWLFPYKTCPIGFLNTYVICCADTLKVM